MNVLPLVLSFLFIFSIMVSSLLKSHQDAFSSELSFLSYHRTQRSVTNRVITREHASKRRNAAKKQTQAKKNANKATHKVYQSRRMFIPAYDTAKLNLTPLLSISSDPHLDPLYEIAASLLKTLYEQPLFKNKSRTEYQLLDAMIKAAHESKKENPVITDLFPKDPELRTLFYKMVKGTNAFDITSKQGIPPFGEFFRCGDTLTAIHFSFASPPLLEAIFGKKIADHILAEERKGWEEKRAYVYFEKELLSSKFPGQTSANAHFEGLEKYISYSKEFPILQAMSGRDAKTKLSVTEKVSK